MPDFSSSARSCLPLAGDPSTNGILQRASVLAHQFGIRLLPYFVLLAAAAGFFTGGILFSMLEAYQNLLPNGAPTVYGVFLFHLFPGIAAAAYALFNAPVIARNSLILHRENKGQVLRVVGVPASILITWPTVWGAFFSLLILTTSAAVVFLISSMVAWRLAHGTPALPVLDWIQSALHPLLLIVLPFKLFAFANVLSAIPINVARSFQNLEDLTDRGGFFRISFLILLCLLLIELLSLLPWFA